MAEGASKLASVPSGGAASSGGAAASSGAAAGGAAAEVSVLVCSYSGENRSHGYRNGRRRDLA